MRVVLNRMNSLLYCNSSANKIMLPHMQRFKTDHCLHLVTGKRTELNQLHARSWYLFTSHYQI